MCKVGRRSGVHVFVTKKARGMEDGSLVRDSDSSYSFTKSTDVCVPVFKEEFRFRPQANSRKAQLFVQQELCEHIWTQLLPCWGL